MPSLCLWLLIWDNWTKTHTGTEYQPSIYVDDRTGAVHCTLMLNYVSIKLIHNLLSYFCYSAGFSQQEIWRWSDTNSSSQRRFKLLWQQHFRRFRFWRKLEFGFYQFFGSFRFSLKQQSISGGTETRQLPLLKHSNVYAKIFNKMLWNLLIKNIMVIFRLYLWFFSWVHLNHRNIVFKNRVEIISVYSSRRFL